MDSRLRKLERKIGSGGPHALQKFLHELLRQTTIEDLQQRAADGEQKALEYLPQLLEIKFPSDPHEELYLNAYAISYDREYAVASFYIWDYKIASKIDMWIRNFYKNNSILLPQPLTGFITRLEEENNFADEDYQEEFPSLPYELLHVWDSDYREPMASFHLIESFRDIEDTEDDSLSLEKGPRWINNYLVQGTNRVYDDGGSGWSQYLTPYATIYVGILPMLASGVWGWQIGTAEDICSKCKATSIRSHDYSFRRYCLECGGSMILGYGSAPQIITRDMREPVPLYVNDAITFLDQLYHRYRDRPWGMNSVLPGSDIRTHLDAHPALPQWE